MGSRRAASKPDLSEQALRPLLAELASLLLEIDITPARAAQLLALESVRAAADRSQMRNGRINQSRIAVMTGMSRVEVRRLLDATDGSLPRSANTASRARRVLEGWVSDRRFASVQGRPKRLPLRGRYGSFPDLVRRYSGDVPARAVLDELKAAGLVSETDGHVSVRSNARVAGARDVAAAKGVLGTLAAFLRGDDRATSSRPSLCRTFAVSVSSDTELKLLAERSSATLDAALEAVKHLAERPMVVATRKRPIAVGELRITCISTTARRITKSSNRATSVVRKRKKRRKP